VTVGFPCPPRKYTAAIRYFGEVAVTRLAYRAKGTENLYPADAVLNLPSELHSHGLRERCAIEASRGSYEEAKAAIERATGIGLGKRQVEELTRRAARDVDAFYHNLGREPAEESDALVISADGKGIVMRPDALRPATKKAAQATAHKLKTRLSKGEKRDRKRVAELAAVYDVAPVVRTPADILCPSEDGSKPPAPEAKAKWLTASVVEDAQQVIAEAFTEALRRDPEHNRPWVALVDGANHQINAVRAEAKAHGVTIHIVVDLVHVLEYLWDSAWSFFEEGDTGAEAFVAEKALAVLEGKAGIVAGAIRRKATALRLDASQRKKADECARYLKNKAPYLDYPTALARGWPIESARTGTGRRTGATTCSDRGALRGAALVVQLPATDTSCWPELSNRYLDLLERKDRPGPARALDARHHPGHLCPCHRGGRPGRS
jgi:tetratricopeptide (TPR) repeat protein